MCGVSLIRWFVLLRAYVPFRRSVCWKAAACLSGHGDERPEMFLAPFFSQLVSSSDVPPSDPILLTHTTTPTRKNAGVWQRPTTVAAVRVVAAIMSSRLLAVTAISICTIQGIQAAMQSVRYRPVS